MKPILYCSLLQDGEILPNTLLPDIPVNISGFSPQNFNKQFCGAVPAAEALARSLNVPAVHMLRLSGVPKFLGTLRDCGIRSLSRSASDYGLSLILGGGEASLAEITSTYSKMAASYLCTDKAEFKGKGRLGGFPLTDKCALWWTFDALKEVARPDEIDWRMISSVHKVAWKTGTSYGFRDAWAVGVTPEYAVGVWVGNAEGNGVPGLTGARTAGPVMFDIFNLLPSRERTTAYSESGWFLEPSPSDGIEAEVCRESGCLKGPACEDSEILLLPAKAIATEACPYHRTIEGQNVFLLPPAMEWYYRQHHPEYAPFVPKERSEWPLMEFIYPESGTEIFIPRQLDGSVAGVTFNLAHRVPSAKVFWHLDNEYAGCTQYIHQMRMNPSTGRHTLTVVDESGNTLSVSFRISDGRKAFSPTLSSR